MDRAAVRDRAADLPAEPGVYQFLAHGDATATDDQVDGERVLYVGKAVDLRDRVRSYADPRGERIRQMVARATDIDYAVTDTETQALLLEANLIKRHRPRYNVRLKDDKSYPLVQLTDHQVPRIEITRDPDPGATVYGPYTDMGRLETVVKAVRETYGLRGCSDHKFAGRERPCLDYDIDLCSGPCVEETDVDSETYLADAETVERFFEGETGIVADPLRREMETAAADQHFERAANLRDRLDAVEALHAEGDAAIDSGDRRDHPAGERVVDVLGVAVEGQRATVARLHSEDGKLVERDRHTLDGPDGESAGDVLAAFVTQFYADRDLPEAVVCSHHLTGDVESWLRGEGVAVRVPGGGREATLVDLALKNARSRDRTRDEGDLLAAALDLPGLDGVERVEGFDVSHAGGKSTVGSDVTFVDSRPEKAHYRRKKLPDGNDDYASMHRLLAWRAQRAIEGRDDRPDPDLLLIDGGRGQLEAAREALAAEGWDVPAISLAKDEEVVVTPDGIYDWDDDAPQLHLLQRVRDEAHRFARQYHQSLRDEVSTVLDEVPGVGPETRKRLLGRFGSVGNVRDASVAEITDVEGVGEVTARKLDERL